jgi:signal peptide peptidase SppA
MSDFAARAALSRMHMREVALAAQYSSFASDMEAMAGMDPKAADAKFLDRRADMCAAYGFNTAEQRKPFAYSNGIAIIPISGSLINRFSWSYEGYVTGYNFIRRQLMAAMDDPDVTGIIYDVNTYGGEAAGCFELASEIRAARAIKPSLALIDSNAYSAGYALASSAGKVVAIPSAGVGSIGVITMHVDQSAMLDKWGLKVTLVFESEHKADGNSFESLPASVRADTQKRIGKAYNSFVGVVAENLGIDEKVIRDTKSRTYMADEALSLGLIHAIASPSQAAQAFFDELSGSTTNLRNGANMTTATNEPGADQKVTQATATAAAEARTAERARLSGILGCAESKGRETLANHLAMNTEMSVENATKVLAAAPSGEPKPASQATAGAANPFAAAMTASGNPNIGADAANASTEAESPVNAILADYAAVSGRKYGTK